MGNSNENFFRQLDELIALFKKLHEKAAKEGVILEDDAMYKNFELLTGNYKLIKDTIPADLIEEMGAPLKEMIAEMVSQLKKELDVNENTKVTDSNFENNLETIDKLLSNKKLTEEEINSLLDKRSEIN